MPRFSSSQSGFAIRMGQFLYFRSNENGDWCLTDGPQEAAVFVTRDAAQVTCANLLRDHDTSIVRIARSIQVEIGEGQS